MRTLAEDTHGLRVLMRMPDLSPAAPPTPAPEVETFVQEPLAPLAAAVPNGTKKKIAPRPETQGVMPEELKRPGRLSKTLTALAVLAVAAAIGIALSNRGKEHGPAPTAPDQAIAEAAMPAVPGGKPTEITQIPEISFPTDAAPTAEAEAMKIQRLPTVEEKTSTAQAAAEGATAQVTDGSTAGPAAAPGVARLSSRIEQPQPQVSR